MKGQKVVRLVCGSPGPGRVGHSAESTESNLHVDKPRGLHPHCSTPPASSRIYPRAETLGVQACRCSSSPTCCTPAACRSLMRKSKPSYITQSKRTQTRAPHVCVHAVVKHNLITGSSLCLWGHTLDLVGLELAEMEPVPLPPPEIATTQPPPELSFWEARSVSHYFTEQRTLLSSRPSNRIPDIREAYRILGNLAGLRGAHVL